MRKTGISPRLGGYTEAAEMAGVDRRTLHRRAVAGLLTLYRNPADHRVTLLDLDEVETLFTTAAPVAP